MPGTDRMDVPECADYLGVSKWTIYSMCKGGEIPHWRVRRHIYFSKATLEKWKREQEANSLAY